MNYQNPFINPFGYGQQMPQQYMQPGIQQQPAQQVVRVNGENGARAFQIGANSSALLLDESGLMVWLVTSDGAGYKTVTPYDIVPHQETPKPDWNALDKRITKLEDMINANTAADTSAIKRKPTGKPNDGTD